MNGKVLVTGGLGNLGSWISAHLANLGYEVYILSRSSKQKIANIKYTLIEADVTKIDELREKLNFDLDFCVHLASYNEFFLPDYAKNALDINTFGTRNLLEVLSEKKLKNFVYLSTFHVYGASEGTITEKSELNPKNDYASTHLFAEYYVKQFGFTHDLKYTVLRLTNSYGAPTFTESDKWYLVLNDLTRSAYENGKIILKSNGRAKRDFIYMGDVSDIIEKLLRINATNEIYNLSSNRTYEVIELAYLIKNEYEKRYKRHIDIEINKDDKSSYNDVSVKNDKLRSLIDFETKDKMKEEINKIFDLLECKL
ncbi:NAD(P)-dependent oxidoreductase [Sulfurimonas sp. HSL-1716]|uniref:NAD-dependent epimerase/dehydratase family protein n=1 Tax=Hydrocurvibacter sulfurireducens TaxID=3131937 RepID=UPI0031F760FC